MQLYAQSLLSDKMVRPAAWACALALALAFAPSPGRSAVDASSPLICAVTVNGSAVSQGAIVLKEPDGTLLVRFDDLQSWRVIPPRSRIVTRDGAAYVPVTSIPGWRVTLDAAKLILDITVPVAELLPTTIDLFGSRASPQAGTGAFFDYDVHEHTQAGTPSTLGALFQFGVSGGGSVALGSLAATNFGGHFHTIRLDTTWQHDYVDRRTSLRIGDAQSGLNAFGGGIHFTGVQLATNFGTDPYFRTFPTPSIQGSANQPSLVDIYVNNALVASQNVGAGPIALTQLPVVTGAGQVQLVVTDVLGRRQVVTEQYYASPMLLKRGLSDYSYEAGFERRNYGTASGDYGPYVVLGSERLGISDRLTGEAHGEFSKGLHMLSIGANVALGSAGVLSAAAAESGSAAGNGSGWVLGYDYAGRGFGFGGRVQVDSDRFRQVGYETSTPIKRQEQAQLSLQVGRRAVLTASYTAQVAGNDVSVKIGTINISEQIGRASLVVQGLKQLGSPAPPLASVFFVLPIDSRHSATASMQLQGNQREEQFEFQQGLPPSAVGMGYRIRTQEGETHQSDGMLTFQGQAGSLTLESSNYGFGQSNDVDVSGAVALLARHAFFTRQITASYGLAEVPGYAGVRVYENNQEIGRTNRYGVVGLPTLLPYQANTVALEARDLPITANVQNAKIIAVPYFRSPAIVRFESQPPGGALVRIVDADGKPLPAGAVLKSLSGSGEWPVAEDGQVYLLGVPGAEMQLAAIVGALTCHVTIKLPRDLSQIPNLGTAVCR